MKTALTGAPEFPLLLLGGIVTAHKGAPQPSGILERLLTAIGTSHVGMMLVAPDDVIVYRSPAVIEMLGIPPEAVVFGDVGRHCYRTGRGLKIETDDIDAWLAEAHARRRSAPHRSFDVDLTDGRWLHVDETTFDGGWLLSIFTDITTLKSNERMLRMAHAAAEIAANTDPLTGLPNRRHAFERLATTLVEADRTGSPLALALIDLDHFKAINDHFGHGVGDQVLAAFAHRASAGLRKGDLLARLGGEEFLVLMPQTGLADAVTLVDRLRMAMDRTEILAGTGLHSRFSAGVALYARQPVEQLIASADNALYRAKIDGRNRVATFMP